MDFRTQLYLTVCLKKNNCAQAVVVKGALDHVNFA